MTLALGNHESRLLPIGSLLDPADPSRSEMDDVKLDELAANIKARGVLQHLIVVPSGERFEIVAGHRRYRASIMAGLVVVPCDVYPDRADADEAVQHAENRFREELSPADEAIWFDGLLERKCGGDVDRLAGYLGEKRSYVESRLLLFQGDQKIFEALQRGEIGIGVASELNQCGDELHRRMLLYQAKSGGATVALVHGWVHEWKHLHAPANPQSTAPAPASASGPVPATNYFTCALCKQVDNVHLMQPVSIHTYCQQAMLHLMVEMYERRHEFHRWPRTLDEAIELVNDLTERFPQLLNPSQS